MGYFESTTGRGLGWRPDLPDHRDFKFSVMPNKPSTVEVPESSSNRDNCSPIRNQDKLGACTGFAITASVEYLKRTDIDPKWNNTIYSPLFVYWMERDIEGDVLDDGGAYIRTGISAIADTGVARESDWPYDVEKFKKKPVKAAWTNAGYWKLGSYYRCETFRDLIEALALKHAVVGGISCYDSMFTTYVDKTGIIPMPGARDVLSGGHAIMFTGYDNATKLVQFKNSWGTEWGDLGYGYLPYDYVRDLNGNLASDFWVLSAESDETTREEYRKKLDAGS